MEVLPRRLLELRLGLEVRLRVLGLELRLLGLKLGLELRLRLLVECLGHAICI